MKKNKLTYWQEVAQVVRYSHIRKENDMKKEIYEIRVKGVCIATYFSFALAYDAWQATKDIYQGAKLVKVTEEEFD